MKESHSDVRFFWLPGICLKVSQLMGVSVWYYYENIFGEMWNYSWDEGEKLCKPLFLYSRMKSLLKLLWWESSDSGRHFGSRPGFPKGEKEEMHRLTRENNPLPPSTVEIHEKSSAMMSSTSEEVGGKNLLAAAAQTSTAPPWVKRMTLLPLLAEIFAFFLCLQALSPAAGRWVLQPLWTPHRPPLSNADRILPAESQ